MTITVTILLHVIDTFLYHKRWDHDLRDGKIVHIYYN